MIGILICKCNGVINLNDEEIKNIKQSIGNDVEIVVENAICIRDEPWDNLKKYDKLIIAACSPQMHEVTFTNKLLDRKIFIPFMIVNLREHAFFVHENREKLIEKVKAQIKAAVEKMRITRMKYREESPPKNTNVLIIGSGISGLKVAECLEKFGIKCYIVEKSNEIGGIVKKLPNIYPYNIPGEKLINDILKRLNKTEIITNAEVVRVSGKFGDYDVTILRREDNLIEIMSKKVSCIVLATGIEEWKPYDIPYLKYNGNNVLTQLELSEMIRNGKKISGKKIFMQLCVGSRDEKHFSYCSRICCMYTLENAITLKEMGNDVYVGFMDIRTTWKTEELFKKARELGIKFIRGKVSNVYEVNGKLKISIENTLENVIEEYDVDYLVLSSALKAPETNMILSQILNIETDRYNFFKKLYPKLRGVETSKRGIYIVGAASEPKDVDECIMEAKAVAKKIINEISKPRISFIGRSKIDKSLCIGCRICYKLCPHSAIEMIQTEEGEKASVLEENCKSCGTCVANCPTGAAQLDGYSTEEMLKYIDTIVNSANLDVKIATFVCYECGYAALDMIGLNKLKYPEEFLIIPVPCLGRVGALDIFKAFSSGADGVLLIGCLDNGCHYIKGNNYATLLTSICKRILKEIGLEEDRLEIIKVVNADYKRLHKKMIDFYNKILNIKNR